MLRDAAARIGSDSQWLCLGVRGMGAVRRAVGRMIDTFCSLTIVRSASSVAADDASVCRRSIPKPFQSRVRSRESVWVGGRSSARAYARVCACGCVCACVCVCVCVSVRGCARAWRGARVRACVRDHASQRRLGRRHCRGCIAKDSPAKGTRASRRARRTCTCGSRSSSSTGPSLRRAPPRPVSTHAHVRNQ